MINIKEGNDIQTIIEIANRSFAPIREEGFDFKEIMPKVYCHAKLAAIHKLVFEDGVPVALAGNLPSQINTQGRQFPFTILGTVSTLPEYRNKGYMGLLINAFHKEDIQSEKVFSILTGLRDRYRHFGYEKCTTNIIYTVSERNISKGQHHPIFVKPFCASNRTALYDLFMSKNPIVARKEETFVDCLSTSKSHICELYNDGMLCGYYTFSERKDCIFELLLTDYSMIGEALKSIMQFEGKNELKIFVNMLDKDLIFSLDGIAENKDCVDYLHFKVYDLKQFLEMLLCLNIDKIKNKSCKEEYVVENEKLILFVDNGEFSVNSIHVAAQGMTQNEFLRQIIGNPCSAIGNTSQIFPLCFGLYEGDLF